MCQSSTTHAFLQELPKCEHHIHIEGSLSPSLLFDLAQVNNIILPNPTEDPAFTSILTLEDRYKNFSSLDDFLKYYYTAMSVLLTASDFESLAYEYFTRAHADGVHHAEVFFDPQAHTGRGVAYTTVVTGLVAAQKRAEQDFGLTSKLILCFLRHLPASDAEDTYKEAAKLEHFSNGTIVGIGLDSSELPYPPEQFKSVYALSTADGIRQTAHAGEEGDSTYISRALDICNVERIDHGIKVVDDEALLQRVAKQKTMFTVCPLSNVRLRCVTKIEELPIRRFLDAGVRFSINSDDPAYFGGYILDNYCAIQDAFGLSIPEWKYIADGAIEGSWCDDERKRVLLKKVDECVIKHS
jgi:adenosine deaminase